MDLSRISDAFGRGRDAAELVQQTQLGIAQEVIKERWGIETRFEDRGVKRPDIYLVHADTGQLPKEFLSTDQRLEMRKEVRRRTAAMMKKGRAKMVAGVAR